MRKLLLVVLILCSAHFNAMAEGNEDEQTKLLDWGILLDVSSGFDVLTDGSVLGLSYFSEHQILTARLAVANIDNETWDSPYPSNFVDAGLLFGHLFSNGIVSGSMSGGLGLVWSDGSDDDAVAGFLFEFNGLVQIIRYAAVGVKVFGHVSKYSFVAAQFCLRIGAVTH